jgi:hypothetical protein
MLARAVMALRGGGFSAFFEGVCGGFVKGVVNAAEQVCFAYPYFGLQGEEGFDMFVCARVGGAEDGNFFGGEGVVFMSAALDEGESLKGLGGRAQVGGVVRVSEGGEQVALRIYDGVSAVVNRFHDVAASELEDGLVGGHGYSSR